MVELYPPGLNHAELHLSTGDMPLSALDLKFKSLTVEPGRVQVELEGGVDIDYFHKFKVTSTDDLALVDKVMAGIVAQCAFSEGAVSGSLSRISAIHGYLEVYNAGISGGARSALATLQTLGAGGQTVDVGLDFLTAGQTVTDLIRCSGDIGHVMHLSEVADVVNSSKTGGGALTPKGYLKISIAGTIRYINLFENVPA